MTHYRTYIFSALLLTVFFIIPFFTFAQEARVWTNQEVYQQGDYVEVYIALPEEQFTNCRTFLIDPRGMNLLREQVVVQLA